MSDDLDAVTADFHRRLSQRGTQAHALPDSRPGRTERGVSFDASLHKQPPEDVHQHPIGCETQILGAWTTCNPDACCEGCSGSCSGESCPDGTIPSIDLTPYQATGIAGPQISPDDPRAWRLVERDFGVVYFIGSVDEDGTLTGLPDTFTSAYCGPGDMELQVGCGAPPESSYTEWP